MLPIGLDVWTFGPSWWSCFGVCRGYGLAGGSMFLEVGFEVFSKDLSHLQCFFSALCFQFEMWALSILLQAPCLSALLCHYGLSEAASPNNSSISYLGHDVLIIATEETLIPYIKIEQMLSRMCKISKPHISVAMKRVVSTGQSKGVPQTIKEGPGETCRSCRGL